MADKSLADVRAEFVSLRDALMVLVARDPSLTRVVSDKFRYLELHVIEELERQDRAKQARAVRGEVAPMLVQSSNTQDPEEYIRRLRATKLTRNLSIGTYSLPPMARGVSGASTMSAPDDSSVDSHA
jgi:hypothetical protein